jgi:glycosyltransferase involved in cell wall biosynthesis
MKHLHLISSLNPAGGGPVEVLKQFALSCANAGYTLEVVCLDKPSAVWLADFPAKVYPLGQRSIAKYGYSSLLYDWLRQNASKYDAVVVHGLWQYHGLAAWRALSGTKTPYFVFTHGMLDPWFKRQYPLKHLKKQFYWWLAEYRVLRDAQAVLFTCEEERRLASQSFMPYQAREIVVNFGTAAPPDEPEVQLAAFYQRRPELNNKRLAVFLSRIHPKKGCDLLIRAFADSAKINPSLHLVMVGPDQVGWQKELMQLAQDCGIQERITWTGMLTGAEKWGVLRAAEVFVLPSHQENFGIAVAEAMAVGTPVLISDKVNIWREIADSRSGFVASDTLEGTESLLRQWLAADAATLAEMGENAKRCFFERFLIEKAAQNLISVLSESCGLKQQ